MTSDQTRIHADAKLASQSSGDSFESAESGRYVTGLSGGHSPNASRTITPEPSDGSTKAADIAVDNGFDPRNTNLNYFHSEVQFEQQISAGHFTKVRGLSECCRSDGKVELHHWTAPHQTPPEGATVVVKRVLSSRVGNNVGKECNERVVYRGHCQRHGEDCLNEIGVYCYLSKQRDLPQYILKMHTVFNAGSDVWLVLEHANEGDLFAVAQALKREGKSLSAGQLMTWSWQLLQAVQYLHKHHLGHRDISMENVLLKDGHVCLMDFGQSVQTHSAEGVVLRYFNALGKPYYRPPECNCPMQKTVDVHVPQGARPGEVVFTRTCTGDNMIDVLLPYTAVPGQISVAEPFGYAVTPVDMFACGVCIFIMATGMPPWKQGNLGDPHFAWVHQCGISQLLKAWKKPMPPAADELMSAMVQSDPAKRPSVEQCLSHTWFSQMNGTTIPVHSTCRADSALFSGTTSAAVAEITAATTATYAQSHADLLGGSFHVGAAILAGDPYSQEPSVRNVEAPEMGLPSSPSVFTSAAVGDFYNVPEDNTCRSAFPAELTLERFTAEDCPPQAPMDESFALEPTTFYVSDQKPEEIGNQLLDFLTMAAGAVVKKIGLKKFSIKASVNGEDGACTLKVRIYDQGAGKHAVEFQRREGESTAFHKVYDQAAGHLSTASRSSSLECKKEAANTERDVFANSRPFAMEVLANQTWPTMLFRTAVQPPGQSGRARAGMAQRRSVPAPTTRASSNVNAKLATAEAIENFALQQLNPVGSSLKAVRTLRSKSMAKRLPNMRRPSLSADNITM